MDSKDRPKYRISAVIPAYNKGEFIGRAVNSVLAQTLPAGEIIVVDDGSADNTADIVRAYGSKVTYIRQDNAGASAARNTGIRAAKGDWIAFLDADDEWLPEKLKLQTEHLRRNPQLQWTTGNYIRCLCAENRRAPDLAETKIKNALQEKESFDNYFSACKAGFTGCTDMTVARKDLLCKAGLFRVGQKRFNDLDMWLRIAYLVPAIGFIPQPLSVYHLNIRHSISHRHNDIDIYTELIGRHLKLAAEYNRLKDFRPLAAHLLRLWVRAMLFDARAKDIRKIINEFENILPAGYKKYMYVLTVLPKATALGCRAISRVVRVLNLRKRLVRKPG